MKFNVTENVAVKSFREPGLKSSSLHLGGEASWFQKCIPDSLTTRFVSEKSGSDPQFGVKYDYNTHEPQLLLQQRRIKSGKMRKLKQSDLLYVANTTEFPKLIDFSFTTMHSGNCSRLLQCNIKE